MSNGLLSISCLPEIVARVEGGKRTNVYRESLLIGDVVYHYRRLWCVYPIEVPASLLKERDRVSECLRPKQLYMYDRVSYCEEDVVGGFPLSPRLAPFGSPDYRSRPVEPPPATTVYKVALVEVAAASAIHRISG